MEAVAKLILLAQTCYLEQELTATLDASVPTVP
jgi:hypothetical protein